MEPNFLAIFVASLVTLVIGFIWYHPAVFGTVWLRESGVSPDKPTGKQMLITFTLTIIFGIFIGMALQFLTIHQFGALGMVGGDPSAAKPSYEAFMADYGDAFRTFRHGALHAFMASILFAFPINAINGMFEKKSWKYIFINSGYWVVSLTIMGGIICAWK